MSTKIISFPLSLLLQMTFHKKTKHVDINKATQENYRPTKLVKRFDNLIVDYLEQNFNNCLIKGTFPKDFKKAVVHPTHRKDCERKIKL